ncbi:MAG: ribonuclease Z [Candidatus Methanoplasma sp.]|jgi:ribonuclease Z|nr:ribonuclease Z [Candidatus Methanoplasma sp.]
MLEILFLGTGGGLPSRDRAPSCVAVRSKGDIVLFDCGEGAQRQLMVSQFSFMKVVGIFISHLHGDHIFGLPGLLQTMGLSGRKDPLVVRGPKGIREFIEAVSDTCQGGGFEYKLDIEEFGPGDRVQFEGFSVSSFDTDHGVPSIGFVLREDDTKGKFNEAKAKSLGIVPGPDFAALQKGTTVNGVTPETVIGPSKPGCSVVYTGDTVPCAGLTEASKDADVLIHESTYSHSEEEKASAYKHSTASQAAETAKNNGCRALILTHISNRYEDGLQLEKEAREIFPDSFVAADFSFFTVDKNRFRSV